MINHSLQIYFNATYINFMSLFSDLFQNSFSNFSATLELCITPKASASVQSSHEKANSINKDLTTQTNRRGETKSLSKLDLLSLHGPKIAPKDRLISRMVHKLSMKCRKHYYTFFIILDAMKKKAITQKSERYTKINAEKLRFGIEKLSQINSVLFTKYFESILMEKSFKWLKLSNKIKSAQFIFERIISKKFKAFGFQAISKYAQKMEIEEIRIDILISLIKNLDKETQICKKEELKMSFKQIKRQFHFQKDERASQNIMPITSQIQYQENKILKFTNTTHFSPSKVLKNIELKTTECRLKMRKSFNFIKPVIQNCFEEIAIANSFKAEKISLLCKRIQVDSIKIKQVPDPYDRNNLFFCSQKFHIAHQDSPRNIVQSKVEKVDMSSQDYKCESQLTYIDKLIQQNQEQSLIQNPTKKSLKTSCFGSEAVSFKNSLVYERQTLNKDSEDSKGLYGNKTLAKTNFLKRKNQSKVAHFDENVPQLDLKMYRYESAQKNLQNKRDNLMMANRYSLFKPNIEVFEIQNNKYFEKPVSDHTRAMSNGKKGLVVSNNFNIENHFEQELKEKYSERISRV